MSIVTATAPIPKGHTGSTHRTRSPSETFRIFAPIGARLGITRLANVTGLDHVGIPVYAAIRPNARSLCISQGKGPDVASAKTSALMESIELWHGERIALPRESAAAARLSGAIDIVSLHGRAPSLKDETPIDWAYATDILRGEECRVPWDAIDLDDTRRAPRAFGLSTNGLASGNHRLEATLHGVLELIERDATALWFASEGDEHKLDLASVTDECCARLIERIRSAGLLIGVFDATSDLGVPTFACIVADRPENMHAMGYFWGFGCHLAPEVALCRAITEAAQCRLTEISGSRDDVFADAYLHDRDEEGLRETQGLIVDGPCTTRFDARASLATSTLDGDLDLVVERLRRAAFPNVAVADLSHADVGVPVVHVLVPGLEAGEAGQELSLRGQARLARGWT